MQNRINLIGYPPRRHPKRLPPGIREPQKVRPAAFGAGPVPGGERCHFIQKKQLGIAPPHHLPPPAAKFADAANPPPRRMAPVQRPRRRIMNASAPVAHHRSARGHGMDGSKRIDAVLQRH
jgi:hypothetical protein